ncbi:unnamed protein product [Dicrocoelium dendriticum]|nr:unnamed protein product [Dicrocoelium dendriticum]
MKRQDKIPISSRLSENKKLEQETKVIEQRLSLLKSALKDSMPKPLESAGRFCGQFKPPHTGESGEPLWSASRMGATYETIKRRVGTINPSKLKLKTLKHESTESKSTNKNIYSDIIQRLTTQLNNPEANLCQPAPSSDTVKCGQCEAVEAAVACQECSENYCARCFAHFHMKGALRRHHSLPLSLLQKCHRTISQPLKESKIEGLHVKASSVPVQTTGSQTGSCCTEDRMNCAAQTDWSKANGQFVQTEANTNSADQHPVVPNVHFTPAISYAERLMLHRHRRGQIPAFNIDRPERLSLKVDDDNETTETGSDSIQQHIF